MMDFHGIMTALVTPFQEDGSVDEQALCALIDHQIAGGVHSLLLLGGTGEYTCMTPQERRRAVDISVKAVNRRVPLLVGVLETGIGECVSFCSYCQQAGADALLVLTPFYFVGDQDALVEFYCTVDRAVELPILIYNIPYRTNVNVLPDTVVRLTGEMKHLAGIKECAGLGQAMEVLLKAGDKISVLTGDEFSAVSLLAMGAKGAVMATANLVPDAWVRMYDLVQQGSIDQALSESLRYFPLFKALFSENYVSPLKYAMAKAGVPGGTRTLLLPLVPPKQATMDWVEAEMGKLGLV